VILGEPWLTSKNPIVDWKENTVTLQGRDDHGHILHGVRTKQGSNTKELKVELSSLQAKRWLNKAPEKAFLVLVTTDERDTRRPRTRVSQEQARGR